ncbi:MAG: sensor histidine kinase, partial [Anaerolineales bacterium]
LRAAEHLQETLGELQILSLRFVELGFTPEQVRYLFNFARGRLRGAAPAGDPLALSDREEALNAWLAEKNLGAAWQLASTLAAAGVEIQDLEDFQEHFRGEQLQLALAYVHNFLTASTLLGTLQRSTDKIAELVNAVKGYAYMDQAPRQEIDVHAGLENTLVMFSHRLKNVRVVRDYDRSLPQITAYGSELNQVWTNLIDNALDAMHENGELRLRTYREVDSLVVEISDTGEGIPEELQARIFEPFFTSKAPGKGTGLGLDIAYRIVTERHGGHMQFTSEPGHTTFKICLPLEAG